MTEFMQGGGHLVLGPRSGFKDPYNALLPSRQRAWASWNYERPASTGDGESAVCLHYLINRLQPLPWSRPMRGSL